LAKKTIRKRTTKATTAKKKTARGSAKKKTRVSAKRARPSAKKSKLGAAAVAVRGAVAGAIVAVSGKIGSQPADAIKLLETDHRRFEALFKQGEETTARAAKTRREVLATLVRELEAHELVEEKILYPALKAHPEAKDIVLEGFEEHHVADVIVKELKGLATSNEKWAAKFSVLKENIEHHIQEEEGEMFRTARGIFSREQLLEMGDRMRKLKSRRGRA
jgi:hypothetical protein